MKKSKKFNELPKNQQQRLRALAEKQIQSLMKEYRLTKTEVLERIVDGIRNKSVKE